MANHLTNVTPLQDSGEIPTAGSGMITGQTTSQMTNQSIPSLSQSLTIKLNHNNFLIWRNKCLMWSLPVDLMIFLMEPNHVYHIFYLIQIRSLPQHSNL